MKLMDLFISLNKRLIRRRQLLFILAVFLYACKKDIDSESVVYKNDFEITFLDDIVNGKLISFNGSQVIGNYNNSGFELTLTNLDKHDYIVISFDLYIHDSWDGNQKEIGGPYKGGPDKWVMELDDWKDRNPIDQKRRFETTFSNSICNTVYCLFQSYPNIFFYVNVPRMGARQIELPGLCFLKNDLNTGSSLYQIEKVFQHSSDVASFRFYDKLIQDNVADKMCDESWSMDNLIVKIWRL